MKISGLPIRFGIAISGSLIAFFLTLSLFNAHTSPVYSFFNAIIFAFGIYEAIKSFKLRKGNKFNYTNGFTIGISTGFVATILFAIFFIFYGSEIDTDFFPELMEAFRGLGIFDGISASKSVIQDSSKLASSIDIAMEVIINCLAVFTIIIMGFMTTIVLTVGFMQLFKRNRRSREF